MDLELVSAASHNKHTTKDAMLILAADILEMLIIHK